MFKSVVRDFSDFTIVDADATETTGRLTLRVPPEARTRGKEEEIKAKIEDFSAALQKAEGEAGSIYKWAETTLEGQLNDLNCSDNDEDDLKSIINQIKGSDREFTDKEAFKKAMTKVADAILALDLNALEENFAWSWRYHFETSYGKRFRKRYKRS